MTEQGTNIVTLVSCIFIAILFVVFLTITKKASSEFLLKHKRTVDAFPSIISTRGVKVMNPFESEFIQVHHRNGDKTDNRDSNLECLCIKCHSEVDDIHRRNFSTLANQELIKEFLRIHGIDRFKGKSEERF